MKQILFSMKAAASPWKRGQAKASYSCVRLAIQCTGTEWDNIDETEDATCNVTKAIFAYMKVGDKYEFNHVCSAVDLAEIPGTEGERWCRRDYVDILLPSFEQAIEARAKIESDIQYLTREINSYKNVVYVETFDIE